MSPKRRDPVHGNHVPPPSSEYSESVNPQALQFKIINIHFREIRDGKIRNIALNSKRARGSLADYIVKNNIDLPGDLKSFDKNNYKFNDAMSDDNDFFFLKK